VIRQGECFLETHLTVTHARKATGRIGYDAKEQSGFIANLRLSGEDAKRVPGRWLIVSRQSMEPCLPTQTDVFCHSRPLAALLFHA